MGLIGGYHVSLSTTAGLANAILADVQRGYDVSRLEEFPGAVNALTRDEINAAIKKHLNPNKMVLVKAGSGLATFGEPDSGGVPSAIANTTIVLPFNELVAARTVSAA